MKNFMSMSAVLALSSVCVWATNLADPDEIKPIKDFNPPHFITPNVAQSAMIENQFDRTDRVNHYYVTNKIDQAMSPFRLQSGFYGKNFYDSALAFVRTSNFYAMANLNFTKFNGYEDGGGYSDGVRFKSPTGQKMGVGYERFGQGLVLGFVPNDLSEIKFTLLHDKIDDDANPQHQQDAAKTDRYMARLDARLGDADMSSTANFMFRYRDITRKADNFSVRKPGQQKAYVDLKRKIYDLKFSYDADFGDFHNTFGVSYTRDEALGERFGRNETQFKQMGISGFVKNAYRFPELHADIFSIYDTLSYKINEQNKLSLGLNYVYDNTKIKKYNDVLVNPLNKKSFPNPDHVYKNFYNADTKGKVNQEAFSAKLKYEFMPSDRQNYSATLAHMERIGNFTERFSALSPAGNPDNVKFGNAVIGNPHLKNEEHNYIELTAKFDSENFNGYMNSLFGLSYELGGSVRYDDAKNLIIWDRARPGVANFAPNIAQHTNQHGQVGTRNIDATLWQVSTFAKLNLSKNWGVSAKFDYNYGQNDTDDRPLYQIRPAELNLALDYKDIASFGSYAFGAAGRFVAKQSRGDFVAYTQANNKPANGALGIDDKDAAKGFGSLDLYGSVEFYSKFGLRFGVNNVFDKEYIEYITPDHVVSFAPNNIYAPGRTFWLSVHYSY